MQHSVSRRNLLKTVAIALCMSPALAGASKGNLTPLDSKLQRLIREFLSKHVSPSGVFTDSYQGLSHTEGIGVSLLLCAWLKDWTLFERLFQKLQPHKRPDSLYSWKANAGRVLDQNNATDGDLYILWALLSANARGAPLPWVKPQAEYLENAIVSSLLSSTSHGVVLKPGVSGFVDGQGIHTLNLSYVLLPLVDELSKSGNHKQQWVSLRDNFLSMSAYAYFGDYGLPADWIDLTDPVGPSRKPEFPARFSYDAVRVPLFLMWSGRKSHPAVQRVKSFYEKTGRSWVDLRTGELSPYGLNPAQQNLLQWMSGGPVRIDALSADYYQASLQILILAASLRLTF